MIRELLRLVTVDEHGRPTRWRIPRGELSDAVFDDFRPFIDRRLLTTDTDNGQAVLGVAHEAFLSAWSPLQEAITTAATALRARGRVEQAAQEWADSRHPPARLDGTAPITVELTVTNTGQVAGAEVAQVYLRLPEVTQEPPKRLVGFRKVRLPRAPWSGSA